MITYWRYVIVAHGGGIRREGAFGRGAAPQLHDLELLSTRTASGPVAGATIEAGCGLLVGKRYASGAGSAVIYKPDDMATVSSGSRKPNRGRTQSGARRDHASSRLGKVGGRVGCANLAKLSWPGTSGAGEGDRRSAALSRQLRVGAARATAALH